MVYKSTFGVFLEKGTINMEKIMRKTLSCLALILMAANAEARDPIGGALLDEGFVLISNSASPSKGVVVDDSVIGVDANALKATLSVSSLSVAELDEGAVEAHAKALKSDVQEEESDEEVESKKVASDEGVSAKASQSYFSGAYNFTTWAVREGVLKMGYQSLRTASFMANAYGTDTYFLVLEATGGNLFAAYGAKVALEAFGSCPIEYGEGLWAYGTRFGSQTFSILARDAHFFGTGLQGVLKAVPAVTAGMEVINKVSSALSSVDTFVEDWFPEEANTKAAVSSTNTEESEAPKKKTFMGRLKSAASGVKKAWRSAKECVKEVVEPMKKAVKKSRFGKWFSRKEKAVA